MISNSPNLSGHRAIVSAWKWLKTDEQREAFWQSTASKIYYAEVTGETEPASE